MIPEDFNSKTATVADLADLHTRLDAAIEANDTEAEFQLLLQPAKVWRCDIKTEIGIRAARGDTEADDYLGARRQLKQGASLAMAAE